MKRKKIREKSPQNLDVKELTGKILQNKGPRYDAKDSPFPSFENRERQGTRAHTSLAG